MDNEDKSYYDDFSEEELEEIRLFKEWRKYHKALTSNPIDPSISPQDPDKI